MMRLLAAACGLAAIAAATLTVTRFPDNPAKRLTATAAVEPDGIRLSGEVRLTLSVDGPGPLEVTPGKPLLTKANLWRVREHGLPLREKLADGREKWSQVYRLTPLVPGDPKIAIAALAIRTPAGDTTLSFDGELAAKVTTTVTVPSAEAARPVTDIETLPVPPVPPSSSRAWLFAVVPVLLGIAAAAILIVRRSRPAPVVRDTAWALRELSAGDGSVDRYAAVLRQYLAFRFGIPTDATTTPELAARLRAAPAVGPDAVSEWEGLFGELDVARFSGTAAEVAGLADRARALVTHESTRVPVSSALSDRPGP